MQRTLKLIIASPMQMDFVDWPGENLVYISRSCSRNVLFRFGLPKPMRDRRKINAEAVGPRSCVTNSTILCTALCAAITIDRHERTQRSVRFFGWIDGWMNAWMDWTQRKLAAAAAAAATSVRVYTGQSLHVCASVCPSVWNRSAERSAAASLFYLTVIGNDLCACRTVY